MLLKRSILRAANVRQQFAIQRNNVYRRAWQRNHRRGFASTPPEKSGLTETLKGDLPWLVGAIVVTVPAVWYLRQEGPVKPHGHEPGQDHMEDPDHPEHKGESHDDAPAENEEGGDAGQGGPDSEGGAKEDSDKEQDGKSAGTDDSESDGGEQNETPESSDDEGSGNKKERKDGGGDVEGVRGTAPKKDDAPGTTRESISDAKGNKKRINSDYSTKAGEAQDPESEPDKGDRAASSKPAGNESMGSTSGKQEGVSNTDTKHSTNIDERPESSMKPEGPETSKAKGTVDVNRPQK